MDTIISANEDLINLVKNIGKSSSPDECELKIAELMEAQLLKDKEKLNAQKV
ncbi:MAG: hypothetical protein II835_08885 [Fibrobacter sp.]|nr:hypothetical protein [Fibrobacter sp.]